MNGARNRGTPVTSLLASFLGLLLISAVALVSAAGSQETQVGLIVASALALLMLMARSPAWYIGSATIMYMVSNLQIAPAGGSVAIASRVAGLSVLLVSAARFRGDWRVHESLRGTWSVYGIFLLGIVAYSVVLFEHGPTSSALLAGFTFALVCITLILLMRSPRRAEFRNGIEAALLVMLALALVAIAVHPSTAFRGGRVQGFFKDANTLGFFAGVGLMLSFRTSRRFKRALLFSFSALALLGSGSRSALLAVVVGVVLTGLRAALKSDGKRMIPISVIGISGGLVLLKLIDTSGVLILRTNDSRSVGNDYALRVASTSLWRGVGYGNSAIEIANTPLRWLAEGGLIAAICVAVAYVVVLVVAWRANWVAFFAAVFGITSSLFEGWYLAGGSALFLTYWITYISSLSNAESAVPRRTANSPTNSSVQPDGIGGG